MSIELSEHYLESMGVGLCALYRQAGGFGGGSCVRVLCWDPRKELQWCSECPSRAHAVVLREAPLGGGARVQVVLCVVRSLRVSHPWTLSTAL